MTTPKTEEWKFQRQIYPVQSGDAVTVLAYNRDSSAMGNFTMSRAESKELFGNKDKVYFLGYMRKDGKIVTNGVALNRHW